MAIASSAVPAAITLVDARTKPEFTAESGILAIGELNPVRDRRSGGTLVIIDRLFPSICVILKMGSPNCRATKDP
jgi:hypothetical protein